MLPSVTALLASLAAMALSAGVECGLPPLRGGRTPWTTGETLSYDLDVMGMVKAGVLSLDVQRPVFQGTQIPFRARVRNTSVFAKVRRLTGTAMSWVDARTLLPERYRDEVLEDEVRKISDARIPKSGDVTIENQYGNEKKATSHARGGPVLDLLSAAYYLRAAALEASGSSRRRGSSTR
jgi:hypothetical protein